MKKQALIIANGHPPKKKLLEQLLASKPFIVCADGGANTALKLGIKPDAIVGDMDSIRGETLAKFQHIPSHQIVDDESTDLEKAIGWLVGQHYDHITVVCASGKRLDHTIGNLGVLPKFYPDAVVRLVDDKGEMLYVGRKIDLEVPAGTILSLLPLSRCDGVTTKGLKYGLQNGTLELGVHEGTSNVAISSTVSITVKTGNLLLYKVTASHH